MKRTLEITVVSTSIRISRCQLGKAKCTYERNNTILKMPEPMIVPTIIQTQSNKLRTRTGPGASGVAGA